MNNFLIVALNNQEYAFRLKKVYRVIPLIKLIQIPTAPSFFSGLINLEGQIIPVFNLYDIFKLHRSAPNLSQKLIIMEDQGCWYAILVDDVKAIVQADESNIIDPKKFFKGMEDLLGKVIKVNDNTIPVFEFKKLFSELEISWIKEISKKGSVV